MHMLLLSVLFVIATVSAEIADKNWLGLFQTFLQVSAGFAWGVFFMAFKKD
jgi:hypothetical protein